MLIVLWYGAPIHFFNRKVLCNEPFQLHRGRFCRRKGNATYLCSLKQVSNTEKRREKPLCGNGEAVTLSSQNRTIQSKTEHYLEKSHCQKENNLDDVTEVFPSEEHAAQHSFWFTTVRPVVSSYCLLPSKPPFFPTPTSRSSTQLRVPVRTQFLTGKLWHRSPGSQRVLDPSCQGKVGISAERGGVGG